jgi:hypothetical protein
MNKGNLSVSIFEQKDKITQKKRHPIRTAFFVWSYIES